MEIKTKLQNLRKGNYTLKEYMRQVKNLVDSLKATRKALRIDDQIMHILS